MEIKDRAWAASAEALKQNFLGYAPDILSLAFNGEELFEDLSKAYCLRIDPGLGNSFPIIDVPVEKGRKRSPGANITIMVRALKLLTFARIWKKKETKAPPSGLIYTNQLTKRIIEHYQVKPQDFVDAIWTPVKIFERYDDWSEWQSDKPFPPLLKRDLIEKRARLTVPATLPWVSGYSKHSHAIIDTIALADDAILKMHVISTRPLELRLAPGMPATIVAAIKGRRVVDVIRHPLLQSRDAVIQDVKVHAKSTRLTILDPNMTWDPVWFRGGNTERLEFRRQMKAMEQQRNQLEAMIRMSLTIPGESFASVDDTNSMLNLIRQLSRSHKEDGIASIGMTETEMPPFSRDQIDKAMGALLQQWLDREPEGDPMLSTDESEKLSENDWELPSVLQGL